MSYPSLEQYDNAFQRHSTLLADPELKGGTLLTKSSGLPLAISGGFALTYTITAGPRKYAVRCFHKKSNELERRYQSISKRLAALKSPYFLDFHFQPQGIRVDGGVYPIVKMAWARGETLGEFLEDNFSNAAALGKLDDALVAMAAMLERDRIAHGDLQTGNLMVSAGGSSIQLIDYDGMYVDEIKDLGSAEAGHLNFQHPQRKSANPFGPTLDRFSLISLHLALKALRTDPSLWRKTNSEVDAILFRANDFVSPSSSPVFALLAADKTLANDAKNFASICLAPIDQVPSLADYIAGRHIPQTDSAIAFNGPAANGPRLGYIGAYDVLAATDFDACLRRVSDKVEVIGKVVEVKFDRTKGNEPYIFINFGDWRGRIFKVAIWPQGMAVLKNHPDKSWEGKWLTVTGMMDLPYSKSTKRYSYTHVSISITANGQMTLISEQEAKRRLAGPGPAGARSSASSNQEALARIREQSASGRNTPAQLAVAAPKLASGPVLSPNQAILAKIRASAPTPVPASVAPPAPQPTPSPATSPTATRVARQPNAQVRPVPTNTPSPFQHVPPPARRKSLLTKLIELFFN